MNMKAIVQHIVLGAWVIMAGLLVDVPLPGGKSVNDAEARIGRPATPASVAGVARRTSRRTTRRVIRRTAVVVAALPVGCAATVVISGSTLYHCGSTYYQQQGTQYVIVEVE